MLLYVTNKCHVLGKKGHGGGCTEKENWSSYLVYYYCILSCLSKLGEGVWITLSSVLWVTPDGAWRTMWCQRSNWVSLIKKNRHTIWPMFLVNLFIFNEARYILNWNLYRNVEREKRRRNKRSVCSWEKHRLIQRRNKEIKTKKWAVCLREKMDSKSKPVLDNLDWIFFAVSHPVVLQNYGQLIAWRSFPLNDTWQRDHVVQESNLCFLYPKHSLILFIFYPVHKLIFRTDAKQKINFPYIPSINNIQVPH